MKTPEEIKAEAIKKGIEAYAKYGAEKVLFGNAPELEELLSVFIDEYLRATGLDQVIILESDAEPQEGDLVCHPSGRLGYVMQYEDGQVFIDVHGGEWDCKKEHLIGGIIQREDQPVVTIPEQKESSNATKDVV